MGLSFGCLKDGKRGQTFSFGYQTGSNFIYKPPLRNFLGKFSPYTVDK